MSCDDLHPGSGLLTGLSGSAIGQSRARARNCVAVKIRLKRFGRKNRAFWRINAVDSRSPRDGKVLEELGFYDPICTDASRTVVVNKQRLEHWMKAGATPSATVANLLKRATDSATLVAAKASASAETAANQA